jgi:hypothetical protein
MGEASDWIRRVLYNGSGSPGAGGGSRGAQNSSAYPQTGSPGGSDRNRIPVPPQTQVTLPRVYLSPDEILRRAAAAQSSAPALGTTSRAYANAHGAQAGLNVPNSTNATTPGRGVKGPSGTPSLGGGASGGGMGGAIVAGPSLPPMPVGIDLDAAYAEIEKKVLERKGLVEGQYDKSKTGIQANYDASSLDMYNDYMNSRKDLEASVQGLGGGNLGEYDGVLRGIEENSNLQENADLSYLEKMKQGRSASVMDFIDQLGRDKQGQKMAQQEQLLELMAILAEAEAAKAAAASGGGGGRGGGGRGGSSSSGDSSTALSESATETGVLDDAYAYDIMMSLPEGPLRDMWLAEYDRTRGNPMTQSIAQQIDDVVKNSPRGNTGTGSGGGGSRAAYNQRKSNEATTNAKLTPLQILLNASRGLGSGTTATPTTKRTVTTTGKTTYPKTKAPVANNSNR